MFCKNCGTQLRESAAFCHICGCKIETVTEPSQADVVNISVSTAEPTADAVQPSAVPENTASNVSLTPSDTKSFEHRADLPIKELPDDYNFMKQTIPGQYGYTPYNEGDSSKNGFSIASLILGIVSFFACCFSPITAILALIFGIIGRKSKKPGMAIAGIVLSIIAFAFFIVLFIINIISIYSTSGNLADGLSDFGMYF